MIELPLTPERYQQYYQQSVSDSKKFWAEQASIIDWITPFQTVQNTNFQHPVSIKWFEEGTLNACYNCVDRHLPQRANDVAYYWQGDDSSEQATITYQQLYDNVCRVANILKEYGVQKGDRVIIYLPLIPETIYSMLACARIGAVHSVVFGGFSASALAKRIQDTEAKLVITADIGKRGGKVVPLGDYAAKALEECPLVETVLYLKRDQNSETIANSIDYQTAFDQASTDSPCIEMNAEDPLFILYTSGSTGTPKGVLHTTGGYMVYAALTHRVVFNYQPGDVYWCTADVGWVTGHTYGVYGPLANGTTSVIFEGVPSYPDHRRWWQIIAQYSVNIFYTAPTAIRALMQQGDSYLENINLNSLKLLGSVGEPLNPEAWHWYFNKVGQGSCQMVDTWWQTETGGIMMTPLPSAHPNPKPGAVMKPFFGVQPVLMEDGKEVGGNDVSGKLCLKNSWPGQMRTVFGNHQRFEDTYFKDFPGYYFTGDGALRDKDGDYRVTGRVDDVINVSGHRLGTAEIEASINSVEHVAESAVCGFKHPIKGEGIYAFVLLQCGQNASDALSTTITQQIRNDIGAIAKPDHIQFVKDLPKTRSGKIMRRILRKIAEGEEDLGDVSTLANGGCLESIVR